MRTSPRSGAAFAIWRRRSLRNFDVLILLTIALGLAIVSGTELLDAILGAFSFKRSNGTRIVGVAVFAILMSLGPATAATAGFLLLGQHLAALEIVGIALVIVASIAAVLTAPRAAPRDTTADGVAASTDPFTEPVG